MLAAEDRTGFGHLLLDERVADAGAYRLATEFGDEFGHDPRRDQVVDDRRARFLREFAGGDEGCDRRGCDRFTAFVDDEAAVGVTVESQPPTSAPPTRAPAAAGRRGSQGRGGLASWFGKLPSSSKYSGTSSTGRAPNTAGTVCPPMPFPASTATFSGRSELRSTKPRTNDAYSPRTSCSVTVPGAPS